MSESEEEDYMSESFLSQLEKKDVKPGLIKIPSLKRQYDLQKQNLELAKRLKGKNAKETLKNDLSKPLNSDNIGFNMLKKMGFKEGEGLGKSGEGIKNPIGITLRTDRCGLGTETVRNEKAAVLNNIRSIRDEVLDNQRHDFRKDQHERYKQRKVFGIVRKHQKVCYNLDSSNNVTEPINKSFWPRDCLNNENESDCEEDEFEEEDPYDVIFPLNDYLRSTYFYCMWCVAQYYGDEDLRMNCPGSTAESHGEIL